MKSRVASSRRAWGIPKRLLLLVPAVLALLAACSREEHLKEYPQTTFAPVTEYGKTQMDLFNLTLYLGVAVGILVFALLGYVVLKFRYRPGAPEPQQIHGNTRLEIAWTLIPAIILAVIAVPTVRAIFETQAEAPPNALTVEVIGKQWWWEFRYPGANGDTVVTANEVHVPAGRPVEFLLKTDNVLHSFWFPQMGGKRDLITNRVNRLVFTPGEPGIYLGACAEFCGDSHALMRMRMVVHTEPGFNAWLASEGSPAISPLDSTSAVAVGQKLVTQGVCAGCHYIEGTTAVGRSGPALTHFGRRYTVAAGILENNAQNLAAWIRNSPAIKPGSKMPALGVSSGVQGATLTDEQIRYIVAYLQSLQ